MSTQGLDDLDSRCAKYKQMGAGFAKWRAVYTINSKTGAPSELTISENAMTLARYAAVCQAHGIVPIVEPDVVMAGDHDLDKNGQVCRKVSHTVPKTFKASFIMSRTQIIIHFRFGHPCSRPWATSMFTCREWYWRPTWWFPACLALKHTHQVGSQFYLIYIGQGVSMSHSVLLIGHAMTFQFVFCLVLIGN